MTLSLKLRKEEVEDWLKERFLKLQADLGKEYTKTEVEVTIYTHGEALVSITLPQE